MRTRWATLAACAAAFALAACFVSVGGGGGGGGGQRVAAAEAGLHLWAMSVVHWAPGSPRRIEFAIENSTTRTVVMARPDPGLARVDVFDGADGPRVCGVRPPEGTPIGARPETIELAPGDRAEVRVDLGVACRDVAPGEYRFELSYRSPQAAVAPAMDGRVAFSGQLPRLYGELIVHPPRAVAARRPPAARR